MQDLESFVVRRTVCGESTRQYHKWFTEVIKEIVTSPREHLREYWMKRGWPIDEWFVSSLVSFSLYRREPKKCRLLLDCLETSYGHKEKVDPATLTIEHVMPQSIGNNEPGDSTIIWIVLGTLVIP